MLRWICAFCLMATSASGDAWCLAPLENGQPVGGVEIRQPYRLASETLIIPGYPYLIVKPANRFPLHTIRDRRFEELGADYPSAGSWSYRDFQQRNDGTIFGFKGHPRQVFRLAPDAQEFVPLPVTGYQFALYDPHRDRVLAYFADKGLLEWNGQALQSSSLGGFDYGRGDLIPHYIPDLSGYLTAAGGDLYFRQDAENSGWTPVLPGASKIAKFWNFSLAKTHVDSDQNLFIVHIGHVVLVFHVDQNEIPVYAYSVSAQGGVFFSKPGPVLVVENKAYDKENQPIARELSILTRDGPKPPEKGHVSNQNHAPKDKPAHAEVRPAPRFNYFPPLLKVAEGWHYYDGSKLYPTPQLSAEKIGTFPRWFRWKDRQFVLHKNGWSELLPDFSLTSGHLPVEFRSSYDVGVAQSDTFDGILLTHRASGVWFSSDGLSFTNVYDGPIEVRKYLSDVPNEPFGLVLGENGLYLLQNECGD